MDEARFMVNPPDELIEISRRGGLETLGRCDSWFLFAVEEDEDGNSEAVVSISTGPYETVSFMLMLLEAVRASFARALDAQEDE